MTNRASTVALITAILTLSPALSSWGAAASEAAASEARRRGRPGVGPVREPAAPRTGAARPRAGGAGHC